jgi:hypothetical protein
MENLTNNAPVTVEQLENVNFKAVNKSHENLTLKAYKNAVKDRFAGIKYEKKEEEGSLYGIINRLYRLNKSGFEFVDFFHKDFKRSKSEAFKLLGYANLNEGLKYGLTNKVGFTQAHNYLSALTLNFDLKQEEDFLKAMDKAKLLSDAYKSLQSKLKISSQKFNDLATLGEEAKDLESLIAKSQGELLTFNHFVSYLLESESNDLKGYKAEFQATKKEIKGLDKQIEQSEFELSNLKKELDTVESEAEVLSIEGKISTLTTLLDNLNNAVTPLKDKAEVMGNFLAQNGSSKLSREQQLVKFKTKEEELYNLRLQLESVRVQIVTAQYEVENFDNETPLSEYLLEIFEIFKPSPNAKGEYKFNFPIELMFKICPLSLVKFMRLTVGTGNKKTLALKASEIEFTLKAWLKKEADKGEEVKVSKGQFEVLRYCSLTDGKQFTIENEHSVCSNAVISELFGEEGAKVMLKPTDAEEVAPTENEAELIQQ